MKQQKAKKIRGIKFPVQMSKRQKAFLLGGVVIVACTMVLFTTVILPPSRKLTGANIAVLHHYEVIRSALARDDMAETREAAAALADISKNHKSVFDAAISLAKSTTLQSARLNFKVLSIEAVKLVEGQRGYFIMHCELYHCSEECLNCPMDEYGEWVQVNPVVENPFMGIEKTHCGTIKQ